MRKKIALGICRKPEVRGLLFKEPERPFYNKDNAGSPANLTKSIARIKKTQALTQSSTLRSVFFDVYLSVFAVRLKERLLYKRQYFFNR